MAMFWPSRVPCPTLGIPNNFSLIMARFPRTALATLAAYVGACGGGG